MSKSKTVPTVADYLQLLDPALREVVVAVRNIILSADTTIAEQIKWNSPSFYYTGELAPFAAKEYKRDIVVMNLHRGYVLLVFPTGTKVPDPHKVLEGSYPDGRRLMSIYDLAGAQHKAAALQEVIRAWLTLVDKV